MIQKIPDNDAVRPMRRSTRINQASQLKVTGVDSYHGPYSEMVAVDTISCHGCRFKSKYDVLIDSQVMLELGSEKQGAQPIVARAVVKWIQRPGKLDQDGLFHTAVELEEPGNIWSVVSPPADWVPFCHPRKPIRIYVKPVPLIYTSATPSTSAVGSESKCDQLHDSKSTPTLTSAER